MACKGRKVFTLEEEKVIPHSHLQSDVLSCRFANNKQSLSGELQSSGYTRK